MSTSRSPSTCRLPRRGRSRRRRPTTTASRSSEPAACCPGRSRSTPSSRGSTAANRQSAQCRPTVGRRPALLIAPARGHGTRCLTAADSSAISPMTGVATRCRRSRSPRPTRCNSCCSRRPTRRSPMPAARKPVSIANVRASSSARSSVATSPTSCSWACGCPRRAVTCARRSLGAVRPRPTSTASWRPTRRRCSNGCPRSSTRRAASRAARSPAGLRRRSTSWEARSRSTPAIARASRLSRRRPTCFAKATATR